MSGEGQVAGSALEYLYFPDEKLYGEQYTEVYSANPRPHACAAAFQPTSYPVTTRSSTDRPTEPDMTLPC